MVLSRAVTFSCGQDGYTKISSKDQEIGGDQLPSELPTLSEKDKSQESFDHIPLVSETIRLQMLLLTTAAHPFTAGSRYKTHPGDRALSTNLEGASRPRKRRSQFRLSISSTCRTLSTPMGVVRVQAHQWSEARTAQPCFKGSWCAPKKRERWSSSSPRQTSIPAALF